MGRVARKVAARPVGSDQGADGNDPHDAIEREFLGLWLGLARLREQVRSHCGRRAGRGVAKRAKEAPPSPGRKSRRAA